ncbi:MAG: helix-turn-helix domain-containing protein [Faecalibacterium sp.]
MKTYTVKELSQLLGTNPETVRRWIRSGKLKAVQVSKKGGNCVSETDFQNFLKESPKYAGIAAATMSIPFVGPSLALGTLVSSLAISHYADKKSSEFNTSVTELAQCLTSLIEDRKSDINKKEATISQLQNELAEDQKQLELLQKALRSMTQPLENTIKEVQKG